MLNGTEGAQVCLWSQRVGDPTWECSGWVGQMSSTPLLLPESPSRLPLLTSPTSLQCPKYPCGRRGLWKEGDLAWELSRLPGPMWRGTCPLLLLLLLWSWGSPPTSLSFSPPASLLRSQDQRGLEGTSEDVGPSLRAKQTSPDHWAGDTLGTLLPDLSPQGSLLACEPLLPLSHPSGMLVLSDLHFFSPFNPPTSYWFACGFLPSPWVFRSPTSVLQVL